MLLQSPPRAPEALCGAFLAISGGMLASSAHSFAKPQLATDTLKCVAQHDRREVNNVSLRFPIHGKCTCHASTLKPSTD